MLKAKIGIIYQDDDILVVNKPAGVSVTKDRSGAAEFADVLADEFGPNVSSKVRLVHRLDKDTSGVMILAKNKEAQSLFCGLFEKKLVKKTYLAFVTGAISAQKGTISAPLAHSRKNPALMCIAAKKGKEAVTDWELLADFGVAALLAVYPLTGRTHQIRVHLPSIGLALAIDPLYGNGRPLFLSDFKTNYRLAKGQAEKPLMERLTLHAYQLSFRAKPQKPIPSFRAEPQEPIPSFRAEPKAESRNLFNNSSSSPNCFVAPLDKKFATTIKMLTKHNPNGPDAFINPDNFTNIINT